MGSIYKRGDSPFWWVQWSIPGTKKRTQKATPFRHDDPAGEKQARATLEAIERKVAQERKISAGGTVLTVAVYAASWLAGLKRRGVKTAYKYDQRLRDFVLPALGDRELSLLSDDDLATFVTETLPDTGLAPRTQHHIVSMLGQMLRPALRKGLTRADLESVPKEERPKIRDADPMWRKLAVFSREEVELIISSPALSERNRTLWAILFLAGVRIGEALDLRWDRYDPRAPALGRLTVATSYDTRTRELGATKTETVREVPVHPTLAAVLAEWKVGGWERHTGRAPKPGDLIMPNAQGLHWSATRTWDVFQEDLAKLELRPRRQHDARRTFISLALADGASRDLLPWITHGRKGDVMSSYTTPPWDALCSTVSRLQIGLLKGELIALPVAAGQLRPGYAPAKSSDSARASVGGGGLESHPSAQFGRSVTHATEGRQTQDAGAVSESPSERSQTATDADDLLISVRRARAHGFRVLPPAEGAR